MWQRSHRMVIIPPTQLVVGSYSAYTGRSADFPNPTNAVGGLFIPSLTMIVVDLFCPHSDRSSKKLNMNDPPTALVGFVSGVALV
jgi:hypothetical protein